MFARPPVVTPGRKPASKQQLFMLIEQGVFPVGMNQDSVWWRA
jgi:hypothetical protein